MCDYEEIVNAETIDELYNTMCSFYKKYNKVNTKFITTTIELTKTQSGKKCIKFYEPTKPNGKKHSKAKDINDYLARFIVQHYLGLVHYNYITLAESACQKVYDSKKTLEERVKYSYMRDKALLKLIIEDETFNRFKVNFLKHYITIEEVNKY